MAISTITTASIADNAVTTAKIPDDAITSAKASALDTSDITTGTFANARLSAASVTQHVPVVDNSIIVGTAAQSISGTISSPTVRYGTTFTCTANLTVNDLYLIGRMLRDYSDTTLTHTASTAVTITGTGTLIFGTGILVQSTDISVP